MGLKGFHIIFIVCAIALSFIFAFWAYQQFTQTQRLGMAVTAVISAAVGIGLIIYERRVAKKIAE